MKRPSCYSYFTFSSSSKEEARKACQYVCMEGHRSHTNIAINITSTCVEKKEGRTKHQGDKQMCSFARSSSTINTIILFILL